MPLNSYEEKVWRDVESYFATPEDSAFSKFSKAIFKPVEIFADRMIPGLVMERVGDSVEVALKTIGHYADKTLKSDKLLSEFKAMGFEGDSIEELADSDMRIMDEICEASISRNTVYAALEGAGCGLGGLALVAADIPMLLGLAFRTVRQVSVCYGYSPDDEGERAIAFKVFEIATGGTRERYEKLLELDALSDELDGLDPKERAEKAAVMGALIVSREMIKKLVASLFSRKVVQAIPLVGATVGGGFNYYFVSEVGKVSQQVCRRRRLNQRKLMAEESPVEGKAF